MKVNVYAANLSRRTGRRESLQQQFAGRSEFAMLQKAGFAEVRECAIGQSLNSNLRGLERHDDVIPAWANAMETSCFEALKNN